MDSTSIILKYSHFKLEITLFLNKLLSYYYLIITIFTTLYYI